ncbi:CoA transferase [Actinomadura sp. J1-007]|nr:CoA transferase [Actinomadura sp. J1-007]
MTGVSAPLEGIRVVDFGQYIAVPGGTQTLADLGADVVKVEPPAGDQARSIGAYGEAIMRGYNRGKRAVVLDLRDPAGRATALRLAASADVVTQNLRPGVLAGFGLGPADVRAVNPGIVYLTVSGFGLDGPSRARPGLDIAAQAESGIMTVTGEGGGEPQRVGFPVVDHATSLVVAQAVLAALLRRHRTGEGDEIEVSLLDVAVHMQMVNWGEYGITGAEPVRKGNGQPTAAPAADVVATSDGGIVISAYTQEKFAALCELIGRPEMAADPRFADNPARVANRPALLAALSEAFGRLTSDRAVAALAGAGIVAGAVRGYGQVRNAPDVVASGVFVTATAADGTGYEIPGLPYRSARYGRPAANDHVPALGEHHDAVLAELGTPEPGAPA